MTLFNTRRFLPLFLTQFLGSFNDNVFKNALIIFITYKLTRYSAIHTQLLVTFAAGIFMLPFFLFSATAGECADKYEKSYLIVLIKWAEVLLMTFASLAFYFNQLNLLLFLLFLIGMQATFFGPLKYAILPTHLYKEELLQANAFIEAGTFLSILLGTITGGILITLTYGKIFISITLISIAIAGLLSSCFIPKTPLLKNVPMVHINIFKATWNIIAYSLERKKIFYIILAISWFWLVGAVFLAEFPLFTKQDLQAGEEVVTFFFALFSIGIGIGSLLCNKLLKNKISSRYVSLAALGISLGTFDLYFTVQSFVLNSTVIHLLEFLQTFSGWRITLDLLLIGMSGGIYIVPLYVLLQTISDENYRARVIASNNIINAFFMVAAALLTGVLLKWNFTVSEIFLSVACCNIFVAALIFIAMRAAS